MERVTRKKYYATKTLNIFSFIARMLFFLPDKHRKMLRYYGIYAHNIDKKLEEVDRNTRGSAQSLYSITDSIKRSNQL